MKKIGHRGAAGHAPENTLKSFRKALELGVDVVELDVYLCKTGELVVIHDDKVDRTTNGSGYVVEKTFEELRSLDAGDGEKIPTLAEVLDFINRKVDVNIELKGSETAGPVASMIEEYVTNKDWYYDNFWVSSFDHHELKSFIEASPDPGVRVGALWIDFPVESAEFAEKLKADFTGVSVEFINQEFVNDAHDRGLDVCVWTVNDLDDIQKMKNLGVDGIFSNFPDRL